MISDTSVIVVNKTPWLRSVRRFLALFTKWSARSGTFLITLRAHNAACRSCMNGWLLNNVIYNRPFSECMYFPSPRASRLHWQDRATSLRKRYWQKCTRPVQLHTDWNGSYHCRRSKNISTVSAEDSDLNILLERIRDQRQNFLILI